MNTFFIREKPVIKLITLLLAASPILCMEQWDHLRAYKRKEPDTFEQQADIRAIKKALVTAAYNGDTAQIQALVLCDAPVDASVTFNEMYQNYTALHCAAKNGHLAAVRLLCVFGAKIDAVTGDGYTPLDLAAKYNHPEMLHYLHYSGAITSKKTIDLARDSEHGAAAFVFFHRARAKCEVTSHQLQNLFFRELLRLNQPKEIPSLEILQYLLSLGVPIDARYSEKWYTGLLISALCGWVEGIEFFCKRGAAVEACDISGKTALFAAAFTSRIKEFHSDPVKVIHCLLKYGALLETTDHAGKTPAYYALARGNKEILQALYVLGAKFDPGTTQIPLASQQFLQIMRELTEYEQTVATTAFSHEMTQDFCATAVSLGFEIVLKRLLTRGTIDVNASLEEEGNSFLHEAIAQGHYGVVRVLLNYRGTNALLRDGDDLAPAELAAVLFDLTADKPFNQLTDQQKSHRLIYYEFQQLQIKLLLAFLFKKLFCSPGARAFLAKKIGSHLANINQI